MLQALLAPPVQETAASSGATRARKWGFWAALLVAALAGIAYPDGSGFSTFKRVFESTWNTLGPFIVTLVLLILLLTSAWADFLFLLLVVMSACIAIVCALTINVATHGIRVVIITSGAFVISYLVLASLRAVLAATLQRNTPPSRKTVICALCILFAASALSLSWYLATWLLHPPWIFTEIHRLEGHVGPVTMAAFSDDANEVLSLGTDNSVRRWDVASGKELRRRTGGTPPLRRVSLSPDRRTVLETDCVKLLTIRDTRNDAVKWAIPLATKPEWPLALLPGGDEFLLADEHALTLWSCRSAAIVRQITDSPTTVTALCASRDGRFAVWADGKGMVHIHDLVNRTESGQFQTGALVVALALSRNASHAIVGANEGSISVWDLRSSSLQLSLRREDSPIHQLASCSKGHRALSSTRTGQVRVWDMSDGREIGAFTCLEGRVDCADLSSTGRVGLAASSDGTIHLWRVPR